MGRVQRLVSEWRSIQNREKIQLNYEGHRTEPGKVNLHYYHPEWLRPDLSGNRNLGDALSPLLVEWMLRRNNIDPNLHTGRTKHLYAVGSILQMGYQNASVWGSGFAYELSGLQGRLHGSAVRKLDIRCVRGPKTRDTLIRLGHHCPECYGDPVALMPLFYQPKEVERKDYYIIPQYWYEQETRKQYGDDHILSMNTEDYRSVIDRIASADMVASSSLHGLILAEIYGTPAVFFRARGPRFDYKYIDWYESTGRVLIPEDDAAAALRKEGQVLSEKQRSKLMNDLLSSFPYDLWQTDTSPAGS